MQRKLAYADELMRLPHNKQLILVENLNPISGYKLPWFNDPELKNLGNNLHKQIIKLCRGLIAPDSLFILEHGESNARL